jgi:hypothetical protein
LKFYDNCIPNGGVIDVLQSPRQIEGSLNGAKTRIYFRNHRISPLASRAASTPGAVKAARAA